jgi:DNA topoisomerase VI subunit B
MADDFLKEYKEITKDEYDERKKRMLGYFLKD